MSLICLLGGLFSLTVQAESPVYKVETVAGTGKAGFSGDGKKGSKAQLNNPFGVVIGPDQALYICDTGNHVIRKLSPEGTLTTIAGTQKAGYSGDGGPATQARLFEPYEIRFDKKGDLYFVEMKNHLIRKVNMKTGVISTLAGTGKPGFSGDGKAAIKAQFKRPHSIQFGPGGDLFICDIGNHRIRKIDMKSGIIRTYAGTGKRGPIPDKVKIQGLALNGPRAIDFDAQGNMWLALREGNAICRIDLKKELIYHVAGTGKKGFTGHGKPAISATLSGPKGIAIAPNGDIYFADTESHSVRWIDRKTLKMHLLVGTGKAGDGPETSVKNCRLARPHGVYVDRHGAVYVGDSEAHRVRKITRLRP